MFQRGDAALHAACGGCNSRALQIFIVGVRRLDRAPFSNSPAITEGPYVVIVAYPAVYRVEAERNRLGEPF